MKAVSTSIDIYDYGADMLHKKLDLFKLLTLGSGMDFGLNKVHASKHLRLSAPVKSKVRAWHQYDWKAR